MSFEVRWDEFRRDETLNRQLINSLNRFFSTIELPTYLHNIQVEKCKFGKNSPSITLRDITLPLPDFYEDGDCGSDSDSQSFKKENEVERCKDVVDEDNDIQFLFDVKYNDDDIYMELNTSLVLNYPDKRFMELPMNIKMSFLSIHVLCILAWLNKKQQAIFSVLCDIEDDDDDEDNNNNNIDNNDYYGDIMALRVNRRGRRTRDSSGTYPLPMDEAAKGKVGTPLERLTIIKNLQIETEIGAGEMPNNSTILPTSRERQHGSLRHIDSFRESLQGGLESPVTNGTLRNLDKLKQFLLEKLKDFLRREVGWPNWMVFDLSPTESDEDSESSDN